MSEWQPIESAPKDGAILAYWPNVYLPGRSIYNDGANRTGCPLVSYFVFNEHGDYWQAADGDQYGQRPTHWMPLPAPPA